MCILYQDGMSYLEDSNIGMEIESGEVRMNDLSEIKDYWNKKYPNVLVHLWASEGRDKYYGMMMSSERNADFAADTLGQLIAQGEAFLRKVS